MRKLTSTKIATSRREIGMRAGGATLKIDPGAPHGLRAIRKDQVVKPLKRGDSAQRG